MEYNLKCGSITAVVESMGGELVSMKDGNGIEYIWQGDPRYWSGRNPHLFPFVSRLKDGKTRFSDGVTHEMSQHGFARRSEFSVVKKGDDFIVFELVDSENTLQNYPFHFSLRVRHQLMPNGFSTSFEIANTGSGPMPFCIGAHTAFNCPLHPGRQFEDYRLVFDWDEDSCTVPTTKDGYLGRGQGEYALPNTDTIPLRYADFDRVDTLVFDGLRSEGVSLLGPDGHGVHMVYAGFPMIGFWSKPNSRAPFVCLEPWHGCAAYEDEGGSFEEKAHCIILAPGETKNLQYTVTLM